MALGAILAAALTDHSARYRILTIDGVEVHFKPSGTQGSKFGVPLESITVTERGTGGVSSMTFTIEDPLNEITVRRGQEVVFRQAQYDYFIFRGFIASRSIRPWGIGRAIDVACAGVEIILDWAKVSAMTYSWTTTTRPLTRDVIQSLVANCLTGHALPLRDGSNSASTVCTQANPVAPSVLLGNIGPIGPIADGNIAIAAGTTLREAIRQVMGISDGHGGYADFLTVDWTLGLRCYILQWTKAYQVANGPDDYTIPNIQDTAAGATAAAGLVDTLDALSAPTAVYVKATGATALVSDYTTDRGETAYVELPAISDAQTAALYGSRYLIGATIATGSTPAWEAASRGVLPLDAVADSAAMASTTHVGGWIDINDPQTGLQFSAVIGEIQKTFDATTQDWRITYGGPAPSMANLARTLTRNTPN